MKKNIRQKEKINTPLFLWITLPVLSIAFFIITLTSGITDSEGRTHLYYTENYPFILLAEYTAVTLMLIPFIVKAKKSKELSLYLLPLMLLASLGMMKIDILSKSAADGTADCSSAVMFIIFYAAVLIMAFSGHTLTGTAGTLIGTALFPAFGIAFSPFIAAASFILNDRNEKEKKISVIANGVFCLAAISYGIIKLTPREFSFSKKYIPVILICAALILFFSLKKDYPLIPLGVLPLFPLGAGIFFGAFPTPLFILSASISPLAIILLTCALSDGNEKIKGYALSVVHNPVLYIILAVLILHTAFPIFVNPGFFGEAYM